MKSLLGKLGVVVIGLAIFGYAEVWGAEDETRYTCDKIQAGMTQNEVLNVLGSPSDRRSESPSMRGRSSDSRGSFDSRGTIDSRGSIQRWLYNRYGKLPLDILFIDGKVTSCLD